MNKISALLALVALAFLTACGGGGGGGEKQDITVNLGPKTASVAGGQTQQFRATILNPNNNGVTWALSGTGCTGSACGTLGNAGGNNNQGWTIDYTAPTTVPSPATVTLRATSRDDTTKSDAATITITAPVVTVSVTPANPTVILGATQQLTATVKGTTNTAVTWSITGPGTVSSSGLYTAPATLTTPATATVTATSQADNTKSGSTTISIPAVTVAISPKPSTVILGATQQFSATVTNATDTGVTWSMSGVGNISTSGLYSTPATTTTPATITLHADSKADPAKTAAVTFTIPAVTVGISPLNPTVILGATQQFSASVGNAVNTAVTWSMTGAGTLSASGLYTAPGSLTTPASATIMATSVADPSKSITTTVTIPAVGVSVAPPAVNLNGGDSQAFTATVTNATDKTVTWSLTGLGTLSTSGVYTAPTVVPSQQTATIKATSNADPSKSGTATVTLIPISVSVSPATASVPLNTTQQFTATVNGTTNKAVTWSVSGAGCSGYSCGTISSSGLYSAPGALPNPPTVTVKAISAADITKSGTATVTLTTNANAKLTGSFAFMLQGFYGNNMQAVIGSFTADGKGVITSGLADGNTVGGSVNTKQPLTGTYQLGTDNRGTLNITSGLNSVSFRFGLNAAGDKGYMVEIDSSGVTGGGMFRKQTPADFTASKITGDYAFGYSGNGINGERNAAVGYMQADGINKIAQGWMNGASTGGSPMSTAISGSFTFNASTGSANGRGTMNITVQSQTYAAAFYMVDDDLLYFMLENPVALDYPLLVGEVRRQAKRPYSLATLNGPCAFYLNGVSQTPGTTLALIGRIVADGSTTMSGEFARSDAGTPTLQQTVNVFIGTSSWTTGQVGASSPTLGQIYFYLVDQNTAFVLMQNGVALGMLEPQSLPPGGLQLADLQGHYFNRNAEIVLRNTGAFSATVDLNDVGTWTGLADVSWSFGNVVDQYNAGQLTLVSPTAGRITNVMTSGAHHIFYAVTTDKMLVLDSDDSSANQGVLWQTTGYWEK